MLISHRKQFIFTKPVKTAGTSVEVYFEPYCMDEGDWAFSLAREKYVSKSGIVAPRLMPRKEGAWDSHMSANSVRQLVGDDIWGRYFKFCTVRDPFDKVLSYFFMWEKPLRKKEDVSDGQVIQHFREWMEEGYLPADRGAYLIDGEFCMDDFIRYESLLKDLARVCAKVDVPFVPGKLSYLKKQWRAGKKAVPVADYYTDRLIDRVAEFYAYELEKFGYSPPRKSRKKPAAKIDFIGIGAQKAGTTWLYRRLKEIPGVALPPVKELNYFNQKHGSKAQLSETRVISRLQSPQWSLNARKALEKLVQHDNGERYAWYLNWYFSDRNDEWYLSLFKSLQGLKGELTPAYAVLGEEGIKNMYQVAPQAKIIFMLRNPVMRTWSIYRALQGNQPGFFDPSRLKIDRMLGFFEGKAQEDRSNYLKTIERYQRIFPPDQIMIAFYDAIADDPEALLADIVAFIGGDPSLVTRHCNFGAVDNASRQFAMPPEARDFLKRKYYEQIKELSNLYGGYCTKWLNELYQENQTITSLQPTLMLMESTVQNKAVGNSNSTRPASALGLWYRQPARHWNEALPLGNGRLGAMVFGTVKREHLQFNEESLWTGEPKSYTRQGAANHLQEIRHLLFAGKQKEATELARKHFMGHPVRQSHYQPFGDLVIELANHEEYTDYQRTLDLNRALQTTSYRIGEVTYHREILISKPQEVIALKLWADRPRTLSLELWLEAEHERKTVSTREGEQSLEVSVKRGVLHGYAKMRVESDGRVEAVPGHKLRVEKASYVVIYLCAATNFRNFQDVGADPYPMVEKTLKALQIQTYEKIKEAHIRDYQNLFNRFVLELGTGEEQEMPTDQRLEHFRKEDDPALIALYVQYARYLMICSSRPDSHAANLQGIWNSHLGPPWGSAYTTNINTQMNYWLSEVANLSETHEPLFRLIDEVALAGKGVAETHYQSRGWVLHHNTDIWRGSAPTNCPTHGIFQGGSGWIVHHLWEHFLYNGDLQFLRDRAYPLLKSAALFYCDSLALDPKTGWLVSTPSNSPETGGLVYGPSMDHQVIRSLFKICIRAATLLESDSAFVKELRLKLAQIAPDQIGQHGQLQEWVEDKDNPKSRHRHVSHLWGLHPGKEINWEDTPELMAAARQSLEFRGDDGTGWSLAWKINFWARLLEGERAYKLVRLLLRPVYTDETVFSGHGGSYLNLFDAHPTFQIDGNFGGAAGILELLLQSHMDYIHILPALPKTLDQGYISGVKARGGFELDFRWQQGRLQYLQVKSVRDQSCTILYDGKRQSFEVKAKEKIRLDGHLNILQKRTNSM